jgi:CheY-like chemotaxis protein
MAGAFAAGLHCTPPGGAMADILIVDDDPDLRLILRRALEEAGHKAYEAASGW